MSGKELERPLFIDMDFGEALARYAQTKPEQVQEPPGRKQKPARPSKLPSGPKGEPSTD